MKAKYLLILCALLSATAYAWETIGENYVPGRYIQISFLNAIPSAKLDKDTIVKNFIEECRSADVDQCQLAVYDKGKRRGEGIRAVGSLKKFGGKLDLKGMKYQEADNVNIGRLFENSLGYEVTQQEMKSVYDAYIKNPAEAEPVFRGIPLQIHFRFVPGLGKTEYATPLLEISDQSEYKEMFSGMQLRFNFSAIDPLLKQVRPGSDIGAGCYVLEFSHDFLNLGCNILWAEFINK